MYNYQCDKCELVHRIMRLSSEVNKPFTCRCGGTCIRVPVGPNSQCKEALDNGAMTKGCERYVDAERLYKERAGR